jgi:large subunit ribosomal protein L21
MFAVIKTGGRQYRVGLADVIKIEKIAGTVGGTVEFSDVLMLGGNGAAQVGAPLVPAAKVVGQVLDQRKDDKVLIFKKKRRKNYRRLRGHRQQITVVRITDILPDGKTGIAPAEAKVAKAKEPETAAATAEAGAAKPAKARPAKAKRAKSAGGAKAARPQAKAKAKAKAKKD